MENIIIKEFEKLTDVRYINNGWCLYSAYGVWLKLKKDKFKDLDKVFLIQLSLGKSSIKNNENFIKNWCNGEVKADCPFALCYIKSSLEHYIIDSSGIHIQIWDNELLIKKDNIDKFCRSALKNWSWNPTFNRRTQVPKINRILGVKMYLYL